MSQGSPGALAGTAGNVSAVMCHSPLLLRLRMRPQYAVSSYYPSSQSYYITCPKFSAASRACVRATFPLLSTRLEGLLRSPRPSERPLFCEEEAEKPNSLCQLRRIEDLETYLGSPRKASNAHRGLI
jgi:hypothetical protein